MSTRTWLLLNAALLILAGMAVRAIMEAPKDLLKQHKLTQQAIEAKNSGKAAKTARPGAIARKHTGEQQDTWPKIRRGSLNNIWQMSLFSPNRTEATLNQDSQEGEGKQEEELPAPPNFELVGILALNNARVAIIEMKSQHPARQVRRPPYSRGRTRMQPVQPQAQTQPKDSFKPTFMTVHEQDQLGDSGFKVQHINQREHVVILHKDGFDYKLVLNKNSQTASERKSSQLTYATSVRERMKAAAAQEAQRQTAKSADAKNTEARDAKAPAAKAKNAGTPKILMATPMRTRGNVPLNQQQMRARYGTIYSPQHDATNANRRRMRPARQQ